MKRTRLGAVVALPALAAFALTVGAQTLPPGAPAGTPSPPAASPRSLNLPDGALVAPGPAADIEILFTGDVIGYLEPCG